MLNKTLFVGRITADPEIATTTNGKLRCSFKLAVDRSFKANGKERETDFIPCTAWGQSAEFIGKYFKKASIFGVEGFLRTFDYENENGETRYGYEISVDHVFFTEGAKEQK